MKFKIYRGTKEIGGSYKFHINLGINLGTHKSGDTLLINQDT